MARIWVVWDPREGEPIAVYGDALRADRATRQLNEGVLPGQEYTVKGFVDGSEPQEAPTPQYRHLDVSLLPTVVIGGDAVQEPRVYRVTLRGVRDRLVAGTWDEAHAFARIIDRAITAALR